MLRFLGFLVVLCALIGGFGYYRGWFHAGTSDANGQDSVKLTVDTGKLDQDKQQVEDSAHK